jgi:hypothetical protein
MMVMNVPREKMPSRTNFFCDGRRDLRSIGKGVSMLDDLSVAAFFKFNVLSGMGAYMMTSKMIVMEAMLV